MYGGMIAVGMKTNLKLPGFRTFRVREYSNARKNRTCFRVYGLGKPA